MGPRDYLHQFVSLLSVLRSGDSRFLPLLLAKVHDVLPTLANPMLQTVPDTPAAMANAEVDIFEGYGMPMAIPPASYLPSSAASGSHSHSQESFKLESPMPFDKRIEEITSPATLAGSPLNFSSPPLGIDYPNIGLGVGVGVNDYPFPDLHGPHTAYHLPSSMGNFGEGVGGGGTVNGGRQADFKREFEGSLGIGGNQNVNGNAMVNVRRPVPVMRQASSSSFGMGQQQQQQQQMQHNIGVPNQFAMGRPGGVPEGYR